MIKKILVIVWIIIPLMILVFSIQKGIENTNLTIKIHEFERCCFDNLDAIGAALDSAANQQVRIDSLNDLLNKK